MLSHIYIIYISDKTKQDRERQDKTGTVITRSKIRKFLEGVFCMK